MKCLDFQHIDKLKEITEEQTMENTLTQGTHLLQ